MIKIEIRNTIFFFIEGEIEMKNQFNKMYNFFQKNDD